MSKCFVYGEHPTKVRVAKFAPSGKYVASGDVEGKVRVWAWTHPENLLKKEIHVFAGEVEDLCWDGESKRILAVGAGQTKAKIFAWDTGSNLGEIVPHSKKALAGALKPDRPYRMVFGGLDFNMSFYQGPPFKYVKSLKEHTNFVNCIRYAPDGSKFISVSSDKTGIVFDGKEGTIVGKLSQDGKHKGSIYACSWKPDSSQIVTVSADKSAKIWDAESLSCTKTVVLGKNVEDMQVGGVWANDDTIVSLSLSGALNFWNTAEDGPSKTITGHVDEISCIASSEGALITGDLQGRVCVWKPVEGDHTRFDCSIVQGEGHKGKCVAIAATGGKFASVAWDDRLRIGDIASSTYNKVTQIGAQPRGLVASSAVPDMRVVICSSAIKVFNGASEASSIDAAWAPTAIAIDAGGDRIAVGGNDKKVHFFKLDTKTGNLTADGETKEANAPISSLAFSPNSEFIAVGDQLREVRLYNAKDGATLKSGQWMAHTTRVTGIAWSPNSKYICSVSSDRRVVFWSPDSNSPVQKKELAHSQPFAAVVWAEEGAVWAVGSDGIVKRFDAPI